MSAPLAVAGVLVAAAGLALELGVSSAIAEILAGVALGAVMGEEIAGLEWLHFLAELGVLGLMFMAGFEVEADRLRRTWRTSVLIGVSSLAVPAVGVFLVARFWFGLEPVAAGLSAVALSTTSLALVYHALSEKGALKTDWGQSLLAAASVVDVLSMVALAVLMGAFGWGTAVFLIAFVPVVAGLPRLGRWVFRRYGGSIAEVELRFILVVLLAVAVMAEELGNIHPAIVAFTVGLVMSEVVVEHAELEQKLKGVVFSFFAPLFFLEAGTKLDLGLVDAGTLIAAAVLFAAATSLKFVGTALPARLLKGVRPVTAGLLFNYRLSFGIIAASVGLESGLISGEMYAAILLTILASALVPAVLLRDRPSEFSEECREE